MEMAGAIDWDSKFEPITCNTVTKKMYQTCIDEEKFVLMQFTGFTDKNGKEIWEGDIIMVEDTFTDVVTDDGRGPQEACNHLCPVIFKNGTFGLDMLEMGDVYYKGFQAFGHVIAQQGLFPDEMEVIGNVFENPDLVQGEYKL